MTLVITTALFGMATTTAVRSTWSPCGRSMLSTITPLGEAGRGARFATSAAWFVAGAVVGGTCLGGVLAGVAALVASAGGAPSTLLAGVVAAAALVAAASDTRVGGMQLPFHRRQVNELWLDRFRPWVYGAGFGWQIGVGFATYVTSAGLYLLVVLAALRASPLVALAVGVAFGSVRGLAVLLGRGLTDPAALRRFHKRFDAAEPAAHAVLVTGEIAIAVVALAVVWPPAAAVVAALVIGAWSLRLYRRWRAGTPHPRPSALQPGTTSAGVA